MGRHRRAHARRGALVRRAGGDDAARRRPVRLPARSVLAAVGLPLRLDAVHGDPDRHDRRGRGRLRALHRVSAAVVRRGPLPHRADSPVVRLRHLALDGAAARHRAHRAADVDEHARARLGQADSERLHDDEDGRAHRAHRRRPARRVESAGGQRQLRRPVDRARRRAARAGPRRHDDLRHADRAVRRAGRIALFRRCLEQHHVHGRRGQGAAAQHPARARPRHGDRHHAVSARQRRVSRHAALRRASSRRRPTASPRPRSKRSSPAWAR